MRQICSYRNLRIGLVIKHIDLFHDEVPNIRFDRSRRSEFLMVTRGVTRRPGQPVRYARGRESVVDFAAPNRARAATAMEYAQ